MNIKFPTRSLTLNVVDPEKVRIFKPEPFPAYMNRHRGDHFEGNSFIIYTRWHIEPYNFAQNPDELIAKLIGTPAFDQNKVIAGGHLNPEKLDFTYLRPESRDLLRGFIAGTFGSTQPDVPYLSKFGSAMVCINSIPTGWGTVEQVVNAFGLSLSQLRFS